MSRSSLEGRMGVRTFVDAGQGAAAAGRGPALRNGSFREKPLGGRLDAAARDRRGACATSDDPQWDRVRGSRSGGSRACAHCTGGVHARSASG